MYDALEFGMINFSCKIIDVSGYSVKVYVNRSNDTAVVFPLFGRYYIIRSDVNALDLAVNMLFHETVNDICYKQLTYSSYLSSQEDTVAIDIEQVA